MLDWLSNLSVRWALILVGLFLCTRFVVLRAPFLAPRWRRGVAEFAETFAMAMVMVFLVLHRFVFQLFFIPSESMVPTLLVHDRILVNRFVYRFHPPHRGDVIVFHAPAKASPDAKDFVKRLIGLPGETISVVPDEVMIDGRPLFPIINRDEPDQPGLGLRVSPESRLEVAADRLLVDGRSLMSVSPTGQAHLEQGVLFVDGAPVHTFPPGETPRPIALPDAFEQAGHGVGIAFYSGDDNPFFVVRGQKISIRPGYVEINGKPLTPERYIRQTPRYQLAATQLGRDEYFMMGDNRNISLDSHRWGALKASAIIGKASALFWPLSRMGRVN
jgi:signal peptidase I